MEAEAKAATPPEVTAEANVEQAVPFFSVTNIEESLRFYVDGLGFALTRKWIDDGKLRWCWLQLGGAALMLQEFKKKPESKVGVGVSVCFQCKDALAIYHETKARGLTPKRPFVGNAMWVTAFTDPDGYKIDFESPTDVEEETELAETE
jgi:catechol 2,3-dioxygenase-like lactoylglutathione lyase family enzyme